MVNNIHFKEIYDAVKINKETNKKSLLVLLLICMLTAFYPSDMYYYRNMERDASTHVLFVNKYLRHVNTVAQYAIPIILFDKIGIVQIACIGVATLISTHGLKRVLNDVYIRDTRLGERPSRIESTHNSPSGHSSLAASAMAFIMLRYGWVHGIYLVPITLLTMAARVLLKAHTVSAVLSGAALGIMIALLLTSKYKSRK